MTEVGIGLGAGFVSGRAAGAAAPPGYSVTSNIGTLTIVPTDNGDGTHTAAVTGTPAAYVGNYTVQTADLAAGGPIQIVQPGGEVEGPAGTWVLNVGLVIYPTGATLTSTSRWYRANDNSGGGEVWTGTSGDTYTIQTPADDDKAVYYYEEHTCNSIDVASDWVFAQAILTNLEKVQAIVNAAGEGYISLPAIEAFQTTAGTTPATDTDPCGRINDQSSHGNNMLQATSTQRPTLHVSGGYTYVQGDTVDDYLQADFVTTGVDLYFAIALENVSSATWDRFASFGKTGAADGGTDASATILNQFGPVTSRRDGTNSGSKSLSALGVFEFHFNATEMNIALNGGAYSTTTHATRTNFDTLISTILTGIAKDVFPDCKIYGAVAMDGAPSTAERTDIYNLLKEYSGAP